MPPQGMGGLAIAIMHTDTQSVRKNGKEGDRCHHHMQGIQKNIAYRRNKAVMDYLNHIRTEKSLHKQAANTAQHQPAQGVNKLPLGEIQLMHLDGNDVHAVLADITHLLTVGLEDSQLVSIFFRFVRGYFSYGRDGIVLLPLGQQAQFLFCDMRQVLFSIAVFMAIPPRHLLSPSNVESLPSEKYPTLQLKDC